jgi:hypothetical protein
MAIMSGVSPIEFFAFTWAPMWTKFFTKFRSSHCKTSISISLTEVSRRIGETREEGGWRVEGGGWRLESKNPGVSKKKTH